MKEGIPRPGSEIPAITASLSEQAQFFDERPERITPEHLNNFYTSFGYTMEEAMGHPVDQDTVLDSGAPELNSELRKGQTMGQFRRTMEYAAREAGIDMERIRSLQERIYGASMNKDWVGREKALDDLLPMLIPVYLKLRRMGYSHYDLVA